MMNEYAELRAEAAELSVKPSLNPQQKRRYAYLLKAIPVVKEGVSIRDFDLQLLNEEAARNGLPQTRIRKQRYTAEQRAKGECLQKMLLGGTEVGGIENRGGIEFRVGETEGNIPAQIGTYTGLGYFVPTDLYNNIKERMAEIDVLFDVNGPCTVIEDTNGNPKRIDVYNDTSVDTAQIGEAGADGAVTLLQNPGQVTCGSLRLPDSGSSCQHRSDARHLRDDQDRGFVRALLFEAAGACYRPEACHWQRHGSDSWPDQCFADKQRADDRRAGQRPKRRHRTSEQFDRLTGYGEPRVRRQ